jgi:hypothetical protein
MIDEELVGLEKQAAIDLIEGKGYQARIVHEDGEDFIGTMDFRTDRYNLYVTNGIVTLASIG